MWCRFVWQLTDSASDARKEGDTPGRNDKGLVTYDRKIKKDAYFYFRSHWSAEPTLYITSRRFTRRTDNLTDVKVYSNFPKVELLINGKSQGAQSGANRVFVWKNKALAGGANKIEVRGVFHDGKTYADSCSWTAPAATAKAGAFSFMKFGARVIESIQDSFAESQDRVLS
jgi:beta-galactosidase